MKQTFKTITLVAALSCLVNASYAQVVWSQNFDSVALGAYGTTQQFGDTSSPLLNIVTPGDGGAGNAMELTWDQDGSFLNFQSARISYPATGNTNVLLANYTHSFDLQVIGIDARPYPQGLQISIFGTGGGVFGGPKVELDLTTNVFTAGQGYVHYAFTLDKFVPRGFDPTTNSFSVGFGIVSFGGPNTTVTPETFDIDNLQITMNTTPPPPPHP